MKRYLSPDEFTVESVELLNSNEEEYFIVVNLRTPDGRLQEVSGLLRPTLDDKEG